MLVSLRHVAVWYYAQEAEKGTSGWEELFIEAPVDTFVEDVLAELANMMMVEDEEEVCVI